MPLDNYINVGVCRCTKSAMSHSHVRRGHGVLQYMNEKLNRHKCPRSPAVVAAVLRLICAPSNLETRVDLDFRKAPYYLAAVCDLSPCNLHTSYTVQDPRVTCCHTRSPTMKYAESRSRVTLFDTDGKQGRQMKLSLIGRLARLKKDIHICRINTVSVSSQYLDIYLSMFSRRHQWLQ